MDYVERFAMVFSSLFVIVEPFGVIPTFLGLTSYMSEERIRRVIFKATVFAGLVLVFFSLFGNFVFQWLQINLSAFKAAGGILLFLTALDMLRAKHADERSSQLDKSGGDEGHDISFVPLGIPLLAGPGAITSVMVFSRDHKEDHLAHFGIILISIICVFLISYFVLKYSIQIKKFLGNSGLVVIERLMGLLLAAISLQFIFEGSMALVNSYSKI